MNKQLGCIYVTSSSDSDEIFVLSSDDEHLLNDAESPDANPNVKVLKQLPENLDEPLVYLSIRQKPKCLKHPKLKVLAKDLPGWVSQAFVARALGKSEEGIKTAVIHMDGKPWVWATEFENVHTTWAFDEPSITVGGTVFHDSETYYQQSKPQPFDEEQWLAERYNVMYRAVKAKLNASEEVRRLLIETNPHPLLSIKNDGFWGVDPKNGGANKLAKIYEELRALLLKRGGSSGYLQTAGASLVAGTRKRAAGSNKGARPVKKPP